MANKVVSPAEFKAAREALLVREKAVTRTLMELTAARRKLPVVKIESPERFPFVDANGKTVMLADLFDGRPQLIIYHFMLKDGDNEGCPSCSYLMDHIPHLGHLHSRDTTFVAVAPASIDKITAFKDRMGWAFPFYSSANTFTEVDKAGEEVTWKPGNGFFGVEVFKKEGDDIYHTYATTSRGTEIMLTTYALLDMTPMGRQEDDGPRGFKLHDQY